MKNFSLIILLTSITLSISLGIVAQPTWTSNGSGLWNSSSTWTTSGGASGAPSYSLTGTSQVIITNGHVVTSTSNISLDQTAVLKILNGGKLQLGNAGTPNVDLTIKKDGNQFIINNGSCESYATGNGGDLSVLKGIIEWQDASLYFSGDVSIESYVNEMSAVNTCFRAGKDMTFTGVGASTTPAILNNTYLIAGASGNGNFSLKTSTYATVTDLRVKAGSTSGSAEFLSSTLNGSIYSIYGNSKIKVSSMSGTTSLQYYKATTLDPNLNYFSGPKINSNIAQTETCSGFLPRADLAVTSTITPDPVFSGQQVTCTITVQNNGPDAAQSVVLTDNLPASLVVTNTSTSTGSWTAPAWTIGTLANGATATMTITATVVSTFSGLISNTATVTSTTNDLVTSNNSATGTSTATIPIGPTAVNDNVTTSKYTPVTFNVVSNDIAGSSAIVPASVVFVPGTGPNPGTTGTFTVNPANGLVTFTPAGAFTGTATIQYTVCDALGLCSDATISVDVIQGYAILFPASGYGSLAFEDLWPSKGDYDFNDLVLDYQFQLIANTANFVEEINATFVIKANGAVLKNGFGFQLSGSINPADLTVTGSDLTESYITLSSNGTEAGQSKATIIVFDNIKTQLLHPGTGSGVNVTPGAPYVTPKTITIHITVKPNTYTVNQVDISNFNPFLIKNAERSKEIHLPYYPPTDLADPSVFGTFEDNSNPSQGRYYVTSENLPWGLNLYENFDYPFEKQEIISAHLKFGSWAASGGTSYPDWYKDLPGYRNASLIYHHP